MPPRTTTSSAPSAGSPPTRTAPGWLPAAARIAPFALFIGLLALQPLVPAGVAPWLTVARGLLAGALLVILWRHYSELRSAPPAPLREWMLAVVIGLGVFALWIVLDTGWAVLGAEGEGFVPLRPGGGIDWTLAVLRLLGLALVVPVMEELFWRSFLMRWIDARNFLAVDPRKTGLAAFAISCALFALEHSQWFAGLLAGAAYAWLYVRTANLWIPILSHAITNGTLGLWILATGQWKYW